jgi:glycosyltransferase involved in cell wall biosynthesis
MLSIALATCNGERYLPEQLDSFAAQTRLPDELVVCDDVSDDRTPEVLDEFRRTAPFPVRIVRNERRLGITRNFEQAVQLCEGDVIFFSDQDDVWRPEKIARHEEAYASDPGVGAVFNDGLVVDRQLQPLGVTMYASRNLGERQLRELETDRSFLVLVLCGKVSGCTLSFRSKFRDVLIPFSHEFFHDEWVMVVLAQLTGFRAIREPLHLYRQHESQALGAPVPKRESPEPSPARAPKPTLTRTEIHNNNVRKYSYLVDYYDRLVAQGYTLNYPGSQDYLRGFIAHLRRRAMLPDASLPRLGAVLLECVTGRYARYNESVKGQLLWDWRDG